MISEFHVAWLEKCCVVLENVDASPLHSSDWKFQGSWLQDLKHEKI